VHVLLQLIGAVMVLAGFAMVQFGAVRATSCSYLVLNLAGSAILAVLALQGRQWGFLLLEGVWALVSARGLVAWARRAAATGPPR
jgi:nicotinamide riboside transporter PnuC